MIEFVLSVYLNSQLIDKTQVFEDMDRCLYFAHRLSSQRPVPLPDGGRSKIGLESTVINLYGNIKIMRPGAISKKAIGQTLGKNISISKKANKLNSPGLLKKHYSPGIPIRLNCKKADSKAAFIVFGKKYKGGKYIFNLSPRGNLKEAGKIEKCSSSILIIANAKRILKALFISST